MADDAFGAYYRRSAARFPHYVNKTTRVTSYIGWPLDKDQTPEVLAEAGFYYAGKADCTRCFYCGGGLRNWLRGDDPMVEHARWFSECKYVLTKKGKAWVDLVPIDYPRHFESEDSSSSEPSQKSRDLDEMIERIIQKPCAEAMLFLGYSVSIVRAAITKALSSSGWDESRVTGETLARIALDMEDETDYESDKLNLPSAEEIELEGAAGGITIGHSYQVPVDVKSGNSGTVDDENVKKLKEENQDLKQKMKCKICLEKDVSMIFIPCGHLVTCGECCQTLNKCPLCRAKIATRVKAYL